MCSIASAANIDGLRARYSGVTERPADFSG
jgi:hypothetical protein